jgi:mannose-6-phosphate isomerase-like protein (cupin superfamily)
MTNPRPAPVGLYHILQDFECPTASVRVFRMASTGDAVAGHVHRRSMQIYVALEGSVLVDVDGVETVLEPYGALPVWPGSKHSATPVGADAVLMNISIPPLAADDQVAAAFTHESPDMRMPRAGGDIDD